MSKKDVNKIWRVAGRAQLICPQDATAHILAIEMAERKPQLIIHCDLRFLFLSATKADEFAINKRAVRLLETAELTGRKIVPFDWRNTGLRRKFALHELKPEWQVQDAEQFLADVAKRQAGNAAKAELAITSKCFGTRKAHVTVAVNPPALMK